MTVGYFRDNLDNSATEILGRVFISAPIMLLFMQNLDMSLNCSSQLHVGDFVTIINGHSYIGHSLESFLVAH